MTVEREWKPLCRIGAVAAIAVLALVPIQMIVYLRWPPPETVDGWFALFEQSRLVGLLALDLLLIVDQVLIAVMCLALYVVLRRTSPSLMAIALLFATIAVATYIASNPAFEMMYLSERSARAAGEGMLATWVGSAFTTSYLLGALSFLITAMVMLRSPLFGPPTAYIGIVFAVLSLVPASAGTLGLVLSLLSLVPMWIWFVLIARRLFQLGTRTP